MSMKTIRVRGRLLIGTGVVMLCGLLAVYKVSTSNQSSSAKYASRHNRERSMYDSNLPDDGNAHAGRRFRAEDELDPHLRRNQAMNRRQQYENDNSVDALPGHLPVNSGDENTYPYIKNDMFISPQRVVHFDLKGAVPKVAYMLQLIQLVKKLGGTGILFEWEDSFPYDGSLASIRAKNSFTKEEIRQMLTATKAEGLDIIPLVQTFGHLEWILKYEKYAKYRQQLRYPQVICLSDEEAVKLVESAVDQVLAIHREYPMPYFHMGADEAFQVGMCAKDIEDMSKTTHNTREKLMLRHIARIGDYIRAMVPSTRVLMWHDMLVNVDQNTINLYKLGEDIEPVVWNYAENLDDHLYPDLWQRFGNSFPYIWGASAYKGADGPDRYYSNVPHYLLNHESWLKQQTMAYHYFKQFRGIILTGWQRFDHFARLCETLPVGIPSMAVNLQTMKHGGYTAEARKVVAEVLSCSSDMHFDIPMVVPQCAFPGYGVYAAVQRLHQAVLNIVQEQIDEEYQFRGWMGRYNVAHNYSQVYYLDQIADRLNMVSSMMENVAENIRREMLLIFHEDTVDEFIMEEVEPHTERLKKLMDQVKVLTDQTIFVQKPFRINLTSEVESERRARFEHKKVHETNDKILNDEKQQHINL